MLTRLEAAQARHRIARRGAGPSARPEPTVAIGTDRIPPVEHIVILMMENHS
jgi:phospholipase C